MLNSAFARIVRQQWLAAGLVAVLVLTLTGAAAAPARAQDSGSSPRTITVTGTGSASGTPDIAVVQLGVELRSIDLGEALASVNATMDAVIAALEAQGIAREDIQTANFSVYQDYGVQPLDTQATSELRFVVSNIVSVKVRDLSQVSAVIQAALDAGANNVHGLNFGLDDPDALESEARALAVADAQARAQALADAFGVTLGAPLRIEEGVSGAIPVPRVATMEAAVGSAAPVISEGQLSVTMQVTVVFEITS